MCKKIELYIDEIKPYANLKNEKWMYIGLLAIEQNYCAKLETVLQESRDKNNYKITTKSENGLVKTSNEIKYAKLGHNYKRTIVAKEWLDFFISNKCDSGKKNFPFFYILMGLRTDLLCNGDVFGNTDKEVNVYNRFLRTVILNIKSWAFENKIAIQKITHDNDNEKLSHKYLPWHAIYYINKLNGPINIVPQKITFTDSHTSNILQFVDLLTGLSSQALDCRSSTQSDKINLALSLKNKLNDFIGKKHPRGKMMFFPKERIVSKSVLDKNFKLSNVVYNKRVFLIDTLSQNSFPGVNWD